MNKKHLGLIFLAVIAIAITMGSIAIRANSAPTLADNHYPHWRASPSTLEADCSGPTDGEGNAWYEVEYDDSQWEFVSLPAVNDIAPGENRVYRTIFNAPTSGKTYLHLASDDGIWVYINGNPIGNPNDEYDLDGHWGGACQEVGCVGDVPWTCTVQDEEFTDFIDISDDLIPEQENIIAVQVTNYVGDSPDYFSASYFFLSLHPENQGSEALVFDLPIPYDGRPNSNREHYYLNQQANLTAIFDHAYTTEDSFQSFIDDTFSNQDDSTCQDGINCFDGNLALKFTATGSPKSVLPVADGQIITGKSGCLTGDELGCRVCIQHGNSGYSTLYYNMDSNGLVTTGMINKNYPIGTMGQVTDTLYEVNLVTYYDPSSNCAPGKEVDPSGWSSVSSTDPYQAATGLVSNHLWVHPFLMNTQVLPEAGRLMYWQDTRTDIQFPTGTYSETLHVTLAPAPDPTLPNYYVSPGQTFYLLGTDPDGNRVSQLENAIQIETFYDPAAIGDIFPGSLGIYQFDAQTETWSLLPTSLGSYTTTETIYTATATTQTLAPFAVMGEKPYTLTLGTEGNGTATPDVTGPYHYEDPVQLTATADTGWAFSAWSGDLISTTNPVTITMDNHKAITATFTMIPYEIDITKIGAGQVELCKPGPYYYGDKVQLTATGDPGWAFSDWSGDLISTTNPVTITIDGNKAITATFTMIPYEIEITRDGNGQVELSPDKLYYDYGDEVQLTAIPDFGWFFSDWSGDLITITNPVTITINGDKAITATFEEGILMYLPIIFKNYP